jgi:RimJ/RimL family protein N-acetyltransferase
MIGAGKALARKLALILLGDYAAYYVYAGFAVEGRLAEPDNELSFRIEPVDLAAILASPDSLIQNQAHYLGPGAEAYACVRDGRIAGVCIYWHGDRYRKRNFWPLKDGEAKLVQIVSVPAMRGRGVASALIAASCRDMCSRGFQRMYARIWHSNVQSWRAFERAGWVRVALVVEVNPLRRQQPIQMRFNVRA